MAFVKQRKTSLRNLEATSLGLNGHLLMTQVIARCTRLPLNQDEILRLYIGCLRLLSFEESNDSDASLHSS